MLDFILLANYLSYWIIFGLIHTLLAVETVKKFFISKGISKSYYRLIYNIIAVTSMITIVIITKEIVFVIFIFLQLDILAQLVSFTIVASGGILLLIGILAWDLPGFFGFKEEKAILQQGGIYAFARHPVYTGTIIFLFGLVLIEFSEVTISWFLGVTLYCYLGSLHEESSLKEIFREYVEYKKNVGRFFPINRTQWNYLVTNR